jgi:MerR family mercuric resistance operon transcriptional regulator
LRQQNDLSEQRRDARIAELEASRTALERLRSSCASGRKGPCPILDAFDGL